MGGTCSLHERVGEFIQNLPGNTELKRPLLELKIILPYDGVTIHGVWICNRIYLIL
jgi:hypothetical protein